MTAYLAQAQKFIQQAGEPFVIEHRARGQVVLEGEGLMAKGGGLFSRPIGNHAHAVLP